MSSVWVGLPGHGYTIMVGSGLFKPPSDGSLSERVRGRRCLVVTDRNVGPLYQAGVRTMLEGAGAEGVAATSIEPGESSKTLQTMAELYDAALDAGLNRGSVVVALGGGVVGDLAGFLAATYMRGVRCVQVPTSLLAMVDSSVGGKTGVDLPRGKNLVGAFHQPSLVLADVDCLKTLPERELRCGLAEVAKYAFIMAHDFYDTLASQAEGLLRVVPEACETVVQRCCELKTEVVVEDEREGGRRAILNYGHTFGHALETRGGYAAYRHGEAVAVGMGIAADLSVALGLAPKELPRRQDELLVAFGLPTRWSLPDTEADDLIELMRSDKKSAGRSLRFVLSGGMGRTVVREVEEEGLVAEAIEGRHDRT